VKFERFEPRVLTMTSNIASHLAISHAHNPYVEEKEVVFILHIISKEDLWRKMLLYRTALIELTIDFEESFKVKILLQNIYYF
jgi:hypothetical protein